MIFISHRGNLRGPTDDENNPEKIMDVISMGYDVEIDVWKKGDNLFLGHDHPEYEISKTFVFKEQLWCHAKNYEALEYLLRTGAHCFYHQEDDYTITSKGIIWAYPNKEAGKGCVSVMPERFKTRVSPAVHGICTDYVLEYEKKYKNNLNF